MRRPPLLIALLALLAPAASEAATVHVVRGGGWGHGIGLSQYGAHGFARHGHGYREILAHYYHGSDLVRAGSRPVRVLLQAGDAYVRFRGATRLAGVRALRPDTTYLVRPAGGGRLALQAGRKVIGRYPALRVYRPGRPVRLMGATLAGVRDGLYRGALDLLPGVAGGVSAVNRVGIDAYVRGVVPGEMPSSWHREALKAHAVAARSYALATRARGGVFDLYPDTRSQVYEGVSGETPSTDAAVRATARQVLTYDGDVAVTYFFSTSGGHTENVENVFFGSGRRPWLVGVPDPYDDLSPRHRWRFRFTTRQLERRLRGYVAGRFRRIRVLKRGVSPRIVRARVHGTRGARLITGPALRSRLGLHDSWASFTTVSASQAPFVRSAGRGARLGPAELVGAFEPPPPGRRLWVERRVDRRWRGVKRVIASAGGRYRASLFPSGIYRVRAGSVVGPAVRVR